MRQQYLSISVRKHGVTSQKAVVALVSLLCENRDFNFGDHFPVLASHDHIQYVLLFLLDLAVISHTWRGFSAVH